MARPSPRPSPAAWARAFLGLLLLTAHGFAQDRDRPLDKNPSANFSGGLGYPLPNVSLPKHVPAPAGQLTLFADYAAAADQKGVPLYLVNRTASPVSWHSDGSLFMKLERQGDGGVWERAQAHLGSDCGNSYGVSTLEPGQFFQFRGYKAAQGTKARVRYASFLDPLLRSNEGEGLVDPKDVELVQSDDMSRYGIPPAIVDLLSRDKRYAQQKRKLSSQVAALRLLQSFADNAGLRRDAQSLVDELAGAPASEPESERAIAALRKILADPWPLQRSTDALVQRCMAALDGTGKQAAADYGSPEGEPELVCSILSRVADSEFGLLGLPAARAVDLSRWAPLMTRIDAALRGRQEVPDPGVWYFLQVNLLMDEAISNEALEMGLFHPDEFVSYSCAHHLSRRLQWQRLADLGWALSPKRQLTVFIALACPSAGVATIEGKQATRLPDLIEGGGEGKFWTHCLETQPLEAIWALHQSGGPNYQNDLGRVLRNPVRKFLLKEAKRSDEVGRDFDPGEDLYKVREAVEALAASQDTEDVPVLKALLTYRGYLPVHIGRQKGVPRDLHLRRYLVREAACRALLQQGITIPQKVEVQREETPEARPRKASK